MMCNETDFNSVYRKFYPKILHYISRLTDSHDAEDTTQEVFEKVSRGLRGFKGESNISTWVYRIATNTALDYLKCRTFTRSHSELSQDPEDGSVFPDNNKTPVDQQLIRKEMSDCIKEYIDKLPPDYKTVILLSELEGFKNREIADILGISLEAAKIRLHRARASLKKELDKGCNFYHNEQNIFACDRKSSFIKLKRTE